MAVAFPAPMAEHTACAALWACAWADPPLLTAEAAAWAAALQAPSAEEEACALACALAPEVDCASWRPAAAEGAASHQAGTEGGRRGAWRAPLAS
jgi:hypothetical protein